MKHLRQSRGQSIIFMALFALIILAMAGLTIDVGNAYSNQRKIQAGANAAAVAGMGTNALRRSDEAVLASINAEMQANGITNRQQHNVGTTPGTDLNKVYFTAEYINSDGNHMGNIGSFSGFVSNVNNVRVTTFVNVETTFARVVGQRKLSVNAEGVAGKTTCTRGVYPITFHQDEIENTGAPPTGHPAVVPLPDPTASVATILSTYQSSVFKIDRSPETGNFLFLRWNGPDSSGGSAQDAKEDFTGSGTFSEKFVESRDPRNYIPEVNDWFGGSTGNASTLSSNLDVYINNKTIMILPLFSQRTGTGSNMEFKISRFVSVRLLSYQFGGNDKHYMFALVSKDATCIAQAPSPIGGSEYPATVQFTEQLFWKNPTFSPAVDTRKYDIVVIYDYSAAARQCWTTVSESALPPQCTTGPQRAAGSARVKGFIEGLLPNNAPNPASSAIRQVVMLRADGSGTTGVTRVPSSGWGVRDNDFNGPTTFPATTTSVKPNNTTQALAQARDILLGPSSVVGAKKLIILVTSDVARTRADGTVTGCPGSYAEQYLCPRPETSHVAGAVTLAQEMRGNGIQVMAIKVGAAPLIDTAYLDVIAPGKAFDGSTDALLGAKLTQIDGLIRSRCYDGVNAPRPAVGANIVVKDGGLNVVGTGITNIEGKYSINVNPGEGYHVFAEHRNIAASQDATPRNYTHNFSPLAPGPQVEIAFQMPQFGYSVQPGLLTLVDPVPAQCP